MDNLGEHWEEVHQSKYQDVSWWQKSDDIWLDLFLDLKLDSSVSIIDVGAGASLLIDELYARGFKNLSALDISSAALARLQIRMAEKVPPIEFYVADVLKFESNKLFDLWHDRAVFHFLAQKSEQQEYLKSVLKHLKPHGFLILATFAPDGPEQCSGLPVARHDIASLLEIFGESFELIDSKQRIHATPWGSSQPFTIAIFRRL